MGSENDHIIYTAEDIKKYLSGKLGPAEMHAMERASLDDAFLAEAMEGFEGMQKKNWEEHLILLKNDLSKGRQAKVIKLKPAKRNILWKAAAAILIICSGLAITYRLTDKNPGANNSIAVISKKQDTTNNVVTESPAADANAKLISPVIPAIKTKAAKQPGGARRENELLPDSTTAYSARASQKRELKQDSVRIYFDQQKTGKDDLVAKSAAPAAQNYIEQDKIKINNENSNAFASGLLKKTEPVATRKYMAQVVAPDGSPLPFANISISNENFGTYADAKGNFRLISPDSLLNIDIKSAGYITRNFTLRSSIPQNKIILAEDELALKEKTVVAGKPSLFARDKKRRAVLVPDSVINVEPEDGWSNYDTYITNNLSIPADILKNKIHGEVAISFEVNSNGALTNVKIDKSLCDDCDEAALRVIKEGPRWKVKTGNQGTARVKVKF